MKRTAIYLRVSTIEQKKHGLSVDSQLKALKEYCEQKGYEIAGIYNDAGFSASKSYKHRPELLRMISDCQAGKIDLVIFTKLDRFFRNVPDYYACVEQMGDVPWCAIWEDYETETSSGRFKVNIMLSIAQAESDRTSERIKAVKQYQRDMGLFVGGSAPFGYKIKGSSISKDPETEEITQIIFDRFLKTKSVTDVLDYLRSIGSMRSRTSLYNMLKHPVYYGDYNGFKCDAYITKDQHDEIVRQLTSHTKGRRERTKEPYIFNGIIRCACCGNPMTASFSVKRKDGSETRYSYYRCMSWADRTCENNKYISERKLEKYVVDHIDQAFELYSASVSADTIADTKNSSEKKIRQLESKLTRLAHLYEDGDIERDEYRSKRDAIKREIRELNSVVAPVSKDLPNDWLLIYEQLDKFHKRAFWDSIIDAIYFDGEDIEIRI